jgi:AraC family transcriptional regulator of arabinose operon
VFILTFCANSGEIMQILNIGYNHIHDADFYINRPTGSGDYLLILLKTPAYFTLRNKEIKAVKNSFILYKKDTPQYYRACGASFGNDWFHFTMNETDLSFLNELKIPFDELLELHELHELSSIINHMSFEAYTKNHYSDDVIDAYFKIFFYKLSNQIMNVSEQQNLVQYNKLSVIRTKIYNQPYNDWSIDWLSHELAMSRSTFQHLYKKYFHVTAIQDIINSRTEHAQYLLHTTDLSIRKISEQCGYHNEIHFLRQFKKQTGMTPSQVRMQNKNSN